MEEWLDQMDEADEFEPDELQVAGLVFSEDEEDPAALEERDDW